MVEKTTEYAAKLLKQRFLMAWNRHPKLTGHAIALACGVSDQAVSGWKKTGRIDKDHFPALSALLGVPLEYWHGVEQDAENVRPVRVHAYEVRGADGGDGLDHATDVEIPVYDIDVSGGPGAVVPEYVETRYKLPFQIEWLRKSHAKPEDIRIAMVRGSSMEPTLWNGDKVVIHTGQVRIRNDRVFALIYGNEARVKRLSVTADGKLRIVSDNPDKTRYPDEYVDADAMDQVYIIGQVIDRMGGGGL